MLTSIDVKFIFDSARLGLFISANILQIADVALQIVFLFSIFLPCFLAIILPSPYSWKEFNVRHFCCHLTTKTTQPRPRSSRLTVH